ncbi:MAG: molybdenum cofactor guanylyltransferase [Desulfovibrionaceae bacterium]
MTAAAGIILAGGRGQRMGGRAKGLLRVGKMSIVERLLQAFEPVFEEIVISARDPEPYRKFGLPVAPDLFEGRSSLTGIHGGLSAIRADYGFVAACDAPFPSTALIRLLLQRVSPDADVVIPRKADGYREPLFAAYSRRCLPHMAAQLERQDYKIVRFFPEVNVVEVGEEALCRADPELESFVNANTPKELGQAVVKARNERLR